MTAVKVVTICTVDVPNHNGRIYPKAMMEAAIAKMNNRTLMGTIGSDGVNREFLGAVSEDKSVFTVTDLRMSGNDVVGDLHLIVSKHGTNPLVGLTDNDVQFRTAGIGTIRQEGEHVIIENFQFTSVVAELIPAVPASE